MNYWYENIDRYKFLRLIIMLNRWPLLTLKVWWGELENNHTLHPPCKSKWSC